MSEDILRRYCVTIYWSAEDDCFIAAVPGLPFCVAHGDTVTEAASAIEVAAPVYVEMHRKMSAGDGAGPT